MALTSKPIQPLDGEIARLLAEEVEKSGHSRRALAQLTGMSLNRIGIILRQEPPPAAVGEVWLIASALGLEVSTLIAKAEARLEIGSAMVDRTEPGATEVKRKGSAQVPSRPAHGDTPARVRGGARTRGGHK